jgi:adenosylhomocysteine nucleosidase
MLKRRLVMSAHSKRLVDLVILVFCAFGAEYAPLRARLKKPRALESATIRGTRGELGRRVVSVVVSGVGIRRARQNAAIALDTLPGIDGVIITGVAGGLHGDLKIGDVVIGERLLLRREEEFAASHTVEIGSARVDGLAATLEAARIAHRRGALLTSRRAIATPADKSRAHAALGAIAVDMESAVIAQEAAAREIPFVCIRTIMDTAAQNLEGAMLADEDGRVRIGAAARALIRDPRMIGASIRLMRNLRVATTSMAIAIEAALSGRD